MANINTFNELCAEILAGLYQCFPVRRNLRANQYNPRGAQDLDESAEFAWATMEWLEESGHIK